MALSLACRRVHVYFRRPNLQGSVATLSTHVTSMTGSTDARHRPDQTEVLHTMSVSQNQGNTPRTAPTSSSGTDAIFLSGILSKLSLTPSEVTLTKEYYLPSAFPANECASILDPSPSALIRDCPTSIIREIMERPLGHRGAPIEAPPRARKPIEKRAKGGIMKIRRKKMKKHQYIKWKKRNMFKLRAMFAKRKKKKQKLWEERLEGYRFKGLTQDHIEQHQARTREDAAIFLRHLGIPLEEETPEVLKQRRESERLRAKRIKTRYLPGGTLKVTPTPVLPEGASARRVFMAQEQRAKAIMEELGKQS